MVVAHARARLGGDVDGRGRPPLSLARRVVSIGLLLHVIPSLVPIAAEASTPSVAPVTIRRPAPPHPASWRSLDGPRVAVAGAAGVVVDDRAALIGGFTERLEATAAVQIRDPRHGWMPVGTALLEARAEATVVPLDDGSVLVIGGWSGRLPDQTTALGTVERCDPWNPQHRRPVPPPWPDRVETGLEGVAACGLPDGRVLVVHGTEAVIFDPGDDSWSRPARLAGARRGATLVPLASRFLQDDDDDDGDDGTIEVLAIGGGRTARDPAIESILIEGDSSITCVDWPAGSLPSDVTGIAAIAVGEDVVLAGGTRGDSTLDRSWRISPPRRAVEPGPRLPIEGGITHARLARLGRRLVLLGGERRLDGRPLPAVHGAVLRSDLGRVWGLPPGPIAAVRATVLVDSASGEIELVGGYRFDPGAARGARTRVLDADTRLNLPRLLVED